MPDLNLIIFGASPWSVPDLNTNYSKIKAYIEAILGSSGTVAGALTTLGFVNPILDRTAPGAIGGTTPAAIGGTTGTFSGTVSAPTGTFSVTVSAPTITASTVLNVQTSVAVTGGIANFSGVNGGTGRLFINSVDANGYNAADAAVWIGKNSATGRSINAGGTINASGADYAEYERKSASCGVVAKGQVIGFDAEGKVTDRWADSLSFGVKSTDPTICGGDKWGSQEALGELMPEEPVLQHPVYTGPDAPDANAPREQVDAWTAARASHADACAAADQEHAAAMAHYTAAKTAYAELLEAARVKVDRVAYAGKVPVNVIGATAGDYIVPVAFEDGGISCVAVPKAAITFEQYRVAVGQVRRVLPDGRAEIAVKVG